MNESYIGQLGQAIGRMKRGSVISVSDFLSIASPKTVSKMLTRMHESGSIQKVLRSIFWIPDGKHSAPDPDAVARALARENNWTLVPSGETALHLVGIQKERPHVWTYITNGTYRNYDFNGIKISFTHAGKKTMDLLSDKTHLLVQSIRALGKERLTDEILEKLASFYGKAHLQGLVDETKRASDWVRKVIIRMVGLSSKKLTIKGNISR